MDGSHTQIWFLVNTAELIDFAQRNMLLVGIFGALTVAIIVNEVKHLTRGFKSISGAGLTRLLNSDSGVVLDVSPAVDYAKGHISGSVNVPMSEFKADHRAVAGAKDKPVVLVCRKGVNAVAAAAQLKKAGFTDVAVLDGGIENWASDGNLLVTGKTAKAPKGGKSGKDKA